MKCNNAPPKSRDVQKIKNAKPTIRSVTPPEVPPSNVRQTETHGPPNQRKEFKNNRKWPNMSFSAISMLQQEEKHTKVEKGRHLLPQPAVNAIESQRYRKTAIAPLGWRGQLVALPSEVLDLQFILLLWAI